MTLAETKANLELFVKAGLVEKRWNAHRTCNEYRITEKGRNTSIEELARIVKSLVEAEK